MTRFLASAAALTFALVASTASAQDVTQTGVVGESGVAGYPVQITASNGIVYNCEAEVGSQNGVPVRTCVRANATTGITDNGAYAAAAGVVLVAFLADGSSSTTSSN
ncbi:hypothetical protein [Sulfitobacter sabulilitoris]|uniref:Uncharacterized protein n=1 Tax=Sulfitobacter sabulilitoris TaxID=2562655 RepID=A0A5S3PJS7_9RHOB|nr:hypothetical protein [Sulfitobacter sabulilitoris]TMM54561.1 hypothetical protein FDT80_02915 [Sulfitobacter sabulilitoris]